MNDLSRLQESWLRDLNALRDDLRHAEEESARKLLAALIHERRELAGALGSIVLRLEASEKAAEAFRVEQRSFNLIALRYLEASVVVPGPPAVSPSSDSVVEVAAESNGGTQ